MPISNNKKAATIRNLWYLRVAKPIEEANAVVEAIRAAIVANGLEGEFSGAELTAMLGVETDLQALAGLPGITSAEAAYIAGHRAQALIIAGVND